MTSPVKDHEQNKIILARMLLDYPKANLPHQPLHDVVSELETARETILRSLTPDFGGAPWKHYATPILAQIGEASVKKHVKALRTQFIDTFAKDVLGTSNEKEINALKKEMEGTVNQKRACVHSVLGALSKKHEELLKFGVYAHKQAGLKIGELREQLKSEASYYNSLWNLAKFFVDHQLNDFYNQLMTEMLLVTSSERGAPRVLSSEDRLKDMTSYEEKTKNELIVKVVELFFQGASESEVSEYRDLLAKEGFLQKMEAAKIEAFETLDLWKAEKLGAFKKSL
jgi:hypothetical protein